MKNFDMKRFGRVVKLDFAEGLKPMLWGALCMLLLYLFFFWFAHNIGFHSWGGENEWRIVHICESVGAFSLFATLIYFLIAASTAYRGEQKKQQRIAWLMLPASNLEKFVARWIYLLVFSLVGCLMFFVADTIHIAFLSAVGDPVKTATYYFFTMMPRTDEYRQIMQIATFYGMMTMIHAFYLLCGVLFRKYHFIVASALLAVMFTGMVAFFNSTPPVDHYEPSAVSPETVFFGLEVLVIAVLTWLSYCLFCRWQVITRKFVNL